jgi:hypothetical protein
MENGSTTNGGKLALYAEMKRKSYGWKIGRLNLVVPEIEFERSDARPGAPHTNHQSKRLVA